jgi:hypothetical protein
MGQYEPIDSDSRPGPRKAESPFANKDGWQITDQYRVNQPHDRRSRRLSQA